MSICVELLLAVLIFVNVFVVCFACCYCLFVLFVLIVVVMF